MKLKLTCQQRPRTFTPVRCRVPRADIDPDRLLLFDESRGGPVPVQARARGEKIELNWIVDSIAPGQARTYSLRESASPPRESLVTLNRQNGRLQIMQGGEECADFHYSPEVARPCIYPLTDPFGNPMTRLCSGEVSGSRPAEHRHHRSIWTGWGDINGGDNWRDRGESGTMVHRCFEEVEEGPVLGRFVSLIDWLDAEGQNQLTERREYRFYNMPASMRLFDIDTRFCAVEDDVRFGDTKAGGIIAVRMGPRRSVSDGGRLENAQGGTSERDCWGRRSQWCDCSGPPGEKRAGLAIFDHPTNFRYPTFWHARDYGLLAANPFGLSHFKRDQTVNGGLVVPQGEEIRFQYRAYVHPGDAEQGNVEGRFTEWMYPPVVEVEQNQ